MLTNNTITEQSRSRLLEDIPNQMENTMARPPHVANLTTTLQVGSSSHMQSKSREQMLDLDENSLRNPLAFVRSAMDSKHSESSLCT